MPRKKHLDNAPVDETAPAETTAVPETAATLAGDAPFFDDTAAGDSVLAPTITEPDATAPRQRGPNWPAPSAVAISGDRIVRDRGFRSPLRDSLSSVTERLGAKFWSTNKRFDWALDAWRHHYEFTRFYFQQNVLVDVWPRMNGGTRKEADKKRACVDAENEKRLERGEAPIGYISFVRGSVVPDSAFDDALSGKTMDLIEPMGEGLLV